MHPLHTVFHESILAKINNKPASDHAQQFGYYGILMACATVCDLIKNRSNTK